MILAILMLITQLLLVWRCLIEVKHDHIVILMQDAKLPNFKELGDGWHKASLWDYVCVMALTCAPWLVLHQNWRITIALAIIAALYRGTVFQNGLNLKRGRGFFYLGSGSWDGTYKRILGKYAAQIIFVISGLLVFALNFYIWSNLNPFK